MKSYIALLLMLLTNSCQEIKNISVSGVVTDVASKKPLANCEVVLLCWRSSTHAGLYVEKAVIITNEQGQFTARFEQGMRIDLAAKAAGYQIYTQENAALTNRQVGFSVTLTKVINASPTIVHSLDKSRFLEHSQQPSIAIRDVYRQNRKLETIYFGINLKDGQTTSSKSEADIFGERDGSDLFPAILVASGNGGLLPIFREDLKKSIIYEMTEAPAAGYITRYKLKGNEAGFFVKLRDGTYAKLILIPEKADSSVPYNGGYYLEYSLSFYWIYESNGSKNLTVNPNVDLEEYLLNSALHPNDNLSRK
jgi:hypothetical protein